VVYYRPYFKMEMEMDLELIGWAIAVLFFVFCALILPSQGINNSIQIPVKVARWGLLICFLSVLFLAVVYVSTLLK